MSFVISANRSEASQTLQGFSAPLSEMYSMNWIMFLPNVIIDAKLGCFWYIELNLGQSGDLKPFLEIENDYLKLVGFLLNRKHTKLHLLNACTNLIRKRSSLKLIEQVFEKINEFYKYSLLLSSRLSEGEAGTYVKDSAGDGRGNLTGNDNLGNKTNLFSNDAKTFYY